MFNFQKEIVINNPNDVVPVESQLGAKIRVNGGEADYFVKYIDGGKIYKTAPAPAVNGEVSLKAAILPTLEEGQHMQIRLELGLDGDYRGDFGSALYYFRKPILVDINSAKPEAIKKALDAVAISSERLFSVILLNGDAEAKSNETPDGVRIIFSDPAIKLRKGEIIVFAGGELDEVKDTIVVEPSKKNEPGFGTYEYVLHNLRMPTSANYRFNSPNAEEMPIKGQTYTQYSFSYTVPRPGLGGVSAAGQAIHSTTVHTLYVAGTLNESTVFAGLTVVDAKVSAKELPAIYGASAADAAGKLAENAAADAALKEEVKKNRAAIKAQHEKDQVDAVKNLGDIA